MVDVVAVAPPITRLCAALLAPHCALTVPDPAVLVLQPARTVAARDSRRHRARLEAAAVDPAGRDWVVGLHDAARLRGRRRTRPDHRRQRRHRRQRVRDYAARPVDGARPPQRALPPLAAALPELLRREANGDSDVPDQQPGGCGRGRHRRAPADSPERRHPRRHVLHRLRARPHAGSALAVRRAIHLRIDRLLRTTHRAQARERARARGPVALDRPRGDRDAAGDRRLRT